MAHGIALKGLNMTRKALWVAGIVLGTAAISTRGWADAPLGFYLGAGVGQAHVRNSAEIVGDTGFDYSFDQTHAAWKAIAGIRPLAALGVEAEYFDFGNADGPAVGGFGGLSRASSRAGALFGVGYLPIPLPFLDVFGKLGIARARTTATEIGPIPFCPAGAPCASQPTPLYLSQWSTALAYGFGVQAKWGALAARAEYERIAVSAGNPDLFSLSVTWTF
jgi:opacity protein-like surface antigen